MKSKKAQGRLLGTITIIALVALSLADMVLIIKDFSLFKPHGGSMMPTNRVGIVTGLYVQLWGILFISSYFFEKQCFLFRGLIQICKNIGSPKSRKTALFTGILSLFIGTIALIAALLGFYI